MLEDQSMNKSVEEIAFAIWQSEGKPEGKSLEHWLQTEKIVNIVNISNTVNAISVNWTLIYDSSYQLNDGIDQIDDEMITMENSIKKLLGNQSMNKIMENTASQNLQQFHLSKEDDAQRQNFLDIKAPEEVPKPSDELDYDEWVAQNETIWCQPK